MQLLNKVIRFELQYSCEETHQYLQQTLYLAPYQQEDAWHFAKRILTYLSLFELHPQLANQDPHGKSPELFLTGSELQYKLWCQIDLPTEKQLHRALHRAEKVLLVADSAQMPRIKALIKGEKQTQVFQLSDGQLDSFCQMLKGHMKLAVWREEDKIMITDGVQSLMLELSPLFLHH